MARFSRPVLRAGQGLILGVLCAVLVSAMGSFDFFRGLERGALNSLFLSRGPIPASPDIVIVEADDATVAHFGSWPLPRRAYADLIAHLSRAGAKTIALDVMFPVASNSPADDQKFYAAASASKRVVLATVLEQKTDVAASSGGLNRTPSSPPSPPPSPPPFLSRFGLADNRFLPSDADNDYSMPPLLALQSAAAGLGHVDAPPELDGILRRIPHLMRFNNGSNNGANSALYPSLALAAAAHFLDVNPQLIRVENGEIVLPAAPGSAPTRDAERRIPLDAQGKTWVNWIGKPESFPTHSMAQVLENRVPDVAFKGKVVLIGITAPGSYEFRASPFSPVQPAVEFQATALNDILLNQPLRGSSNALWFWMRLAFPALIGALTLLGSTKVSGFSTFGLCAALWLFAFELFRQSHLILLIATPILAAILTWSVGIAVRQWRGAQKLRRAEERYSLAVRGANDGLWDWDLKSGEAYFSPRWKKMVGCETREIGASIDEWHRRVHPDDIEQMKAQLDAHLSGGVAHFESQHRIKHSDGRWIWVLSRGLRVCGDDGEPSRMAGSQSDITEQVRANEQLQRNAFYDGLTNLPNRALFTDVVERALNRARRHDEAAFAVLFLDLNRFKTVNDSLGHSAGDALLVDVASRITRCLRPGDVAARLGGDEFAILLDEIEDVAAATRWAECIQRELAQPFWVGGQEIFAAGSIGIALSSLQYHNAEELLRDADTAMYRAKALGRAHLAVFDDAMHSQALSLLRLETDLRRALERDEFVAFYQPIVDLRSGQISGFEALVRWNHPTRGLLPPAEFIPLAEEAGLILALDLIVFRQACLQLRDWHIQFPRRPLTMSTNLSSKQFSQPDLVSRIETIVRETGVRAHCLRLEITEGVLMDNAASAATMLHQLRALGLSLAIDDFGTGYSSLSYLHSFPLDTLKIDQSFVRRVAPDGQNLEIVRTIISLARNLGMNVVAEGVETRVQQRQLLSLACDYGQGYLFSKPIPAGEMELLLEGEVGEG